MRVGVVGCGQVGQRRARIVHQSAGDELVILADVDEVTVRSLAKELGCLGVQDWQQVVAEELDVIIVSTPNKFAAPISIAALRKGKHVLCEKPMGRNLSEALQMAEAARDTGKVLKVGFNHRYHPAVETAYQLSASGAIGPLLFIRCIYGHGGRPGYESEWRRDPDLAGGGELLDQGVHVVDLCRWFLGEFSEVTGYTAAYFWKRDPQMEPQSQLEDNAFVIMRTDIGQAAFWHTSLTQWKNRFLFEVYGWDGYLQIEGRGGSYGPQRLTLGKRRPESGPPEEQVWEWAFSEDDPSWQAEWNDVVAAVRDGRQPMGNAQDGVEAMRMVDAIYRSAREGKTVSIKP